MELKKIRFFISLKRLHPRIVNKNPAVKQLGPFPKSDAFNFALFGIATVIERC